MENSFSSDSDVDPIGSEENAATGSYTEPVVDVTEHESAVTKSNLAVHETDIKDNGVDTEPVPQSVDVSQIEHNSENNKQDEQIIPEEVGNDSERQEKLNRLPLSKIKYIMKADPEVSICSTDAALAICRLTEHFIKFVSEESYRSTKVSGRKTVQKKDVDDAVSAVDQLFFLDGTLIDLQ